MSSQNLILSLHAAIDDLTELVTRSERELDPDTFRSVSYGAARLCESLKESVQRAGRLVQQFENARRQAAPARGSTSPVVVSFEAARKRLGR